MTSEQFEQIVAQGLAAIPPRFLDKLANVAVVVADEPTMEQRRKLKLRHDVTLFGLYEGVPQTRRDSGYSGVLPDKITIFRQPMEQAAHNEAEMQELVRQTVWHELAHHFGLDEKEVRRAETRRQQKQ